MGLMSGLVGRLLSGREPGPFRLPGAVDGSSQILAVDTGDLSDLLFHVPVLQAIRARHPKARIDMLLPENHVSLVQPTGLVRECLVYGEKQLRTWTPGYLGLARGVASRSYDVTMVMSFSPAPALEGVALATGAALRLGPSHPKAYPGVNLELRSSGEERGYRAGRLGAMAPLLGLPELSGLQAWPLPEERRRRLAQLIRLNKPRQEELLVAVDPAPGKLGSGPAPASFHFLLRQLASQLPCRPLPLSLHGDGERLRRFEAGLELAVPELPRDDIFDVVLLLSQCDLVIAANTDLFHFAVSLGVPTLGLFGPEDGATWVPSGRAHAEILRIVEGRRVEVDVLLEAVRKVRDAR